jgi:hypothetical protein
VSLSTHTAPIRQTRQQYFDASVRTVCAACWQWTKSFGQPVFLTSHNSLLETDDNWNIETITITVNGPGGFALLLNQTGNPLARLTGSTPSVTLQPEAGA